LWSAEVPIAALHRGEPDAEEIATLVAQREDVPDLPCDARSHR
jgi:hypothetical protein